MNNSSFWKCLLLVCCLVACNASTAVGQSKPTTDGHFWLNITSQTDRGMYALGMLEGIKINGVILYSETDIPMDILAKAHAKILTKFLSISAQDLRDGMDAFFADYRNRKISMTGAASFVFLEISGAARPRLDSMLERMRASASEK